ncbi:MAG: glycerophosphodiester phosphodiesterase [Pseudomonadota bacterium]|nr:glycerophosphodiester phosphodiesterase [Gammaproteobacteria bacterium]MDQ3582414.1 glycerophosphodiester phosphodiesterase [Pseudomonadota bacterium]
MNTSKRLLVFVGLCMGAAISCQAAGDFPTLTGAPPLVIGHRGASGYLPEHTIEAYRLAIRQGADFIEPDLVSTKDGVLIARHEVNITQTTDVADHPEFTARKTRKTIDGAAEEGWFADDFTLAEIKTLRAVQRVPFRPQQFNGLFQVPTFREVIKLALDEGRRRGRPVGVYPETKHPSYHQSVGLPLERRLVSILKAFGLKTRRDPVIIQSFEVANLKELNRFTGVRLVQLIDAGGIALDGTLIPNRPFDFVLSDDPRTYADLLTDAGLAEIRSYADGIGPWKRYIVSVKGADQDNDGKPDDVNGDGAVNDADATRLPPTNLTSRAHAADLFVHAFTFRNEGGFLASDYGANPVEEYLEFYCLGVDGLFSDFADTALNSRHLVGIAPTICNQTP